MSSARGRAEGPRAPPTAGPPRARRFVHVAWVRFRALPVNWNDELSLRAACADCGDAAGLSYSWDLFLVNATAGSSAEGRQRGLPVPAGSRVKRCVWRCPRRGASPRLGRRVLTPAPPGGCEQQLRGSRGAASYSNDTRRAPRPTPLPGLPSPRGSSAETPRRGGKLVPGLTAQPPAGASSRLRECFPREA